MNVIPLCLRSLAIAGLFAGLASAADPNPATPTTAPLPAPSTSAAPPIPMPVSDAGDDSPREGVVGGVGLYLVQPFFQRNLAYTVEFESQSNVNPSFHATQSVDIKHHLEASPLVWLGYMDESGLGGRARYWYFRQGTSQSVSLPAASAAALFTVFSANPLGLEGFGDTFFAPDTTPPTPPVFEPTTVAITSKLEVQLVDLEAMQDIRTGSWDVLLSGGVRLARVAQAYNFYNLQPRAVPLVERRLLSNYTFEGAGPVVAVEARRFLGDSGLAAYANGRGSLLFGPAEQNAGFGGTVLRNNDANPQFATEHRDRALPILEVELGAEYGRAVGNNWLFAQVGVVAQDWIGAGNASRSAQSTFREGGPIGGAADDSDISFLGLACRLGVAY